MEGWKTGAPGDCDRSATVEVAAATIKARLGLSFLIQLLPATVRKGDEDPNTADDSITSVAESQWEFVRIGQRPGLDGL